MICSRNIPVYLLLLNILLFTACSGVEEEGQGGILVSTEWLQEHMNDPDLILLHAGSSDFYDSIHIPGARLVIPSEFTVERGDIYNELPPADSLVELLRTVGVNQDSRIVLYSQSTSLLTRTARIFLTLDHLGFGDRTFVLNGGLPLWQEEERELTNQSPEVSPGNLRLTDLKDVIIEYAELDTLRWSDKLVLIDVRSDEEYYGAPEEGEEASEGGHIEGAYFLPYQDLLADGSAAFRPDREMEDLFRKAGADPKKQNVVYCGSGIRASVSYLTARHLGYPVLLYDGSYQEWSELDLPLTGPVAMPELNE